MPAGFEVNKSRLGPLLDWVSIELLQKFFFAELENKHTRAAYAVALRDLADALVAAERNVYNVSPDALGSYRDVLKKIYAPRTVAVKIAALRAFFRFLEQQKKRTPNPMLEVTFKAPRVQKVKTERLTAYQCALILQEVVGDDVRAFRDRALLWLLATTGMRVSQLVELKVRDLRLHGQQKSVAVPAQKGQDSRVLMLHPDAWKHLVAYADRARLSGERDLPFFRAIACRNGVSTVRETPLIRQRIRELLLKYADLAGMPGVHPHQFRVTVISELLDALVPIEQVAHIAGHSSLNTTLSYFKPGSDLSRGLLTLQVTTEKPMLTGEGEP